jgi:hypothetical protein
MKDSLLLGLWRCTLPIPRAVWQRMVSGEAKLDFMTEQHHQIRDFVVLEIPKVGKPLSPEYIARALGLPLARVAEILDELEHNMTFLFRDEQGAVEWAYPVTAAHTPHHIAFHSGKQIHAA